jgi:putative DNA primase/helicase
VLPVSENKVPLIKGWPKFATTDADQLTDWWTSYPTANFGIATGAESGFWVIDIDMKRGINGWESIIEAFGEPLFGEHDLCAKSPSGGYHLYYQWDPSIPISVAANVLPGVDIRGETGFIMAPPSSVRIDGQERFYRYNDENNVIPEAPEWARMLAESTLAEKTSGPIAHGSSRFDVREVMEGVGEGNRDNALFRYACHLRACGIPKDLAFGFILEAAARCIPPFPESVAIEKVERAYTSFSESVNPHTGI